VASDSDSANKEGRCPAAEPVSSTSGISSLNFGPSTTDSRSMLPRARHISEFWSWGSVASDRCVVL
jgi:hypothetical protein